MKIEKWVLKNTGDLSGKTVAVTGSTGGIGRELCTYIAALGASLILIDRNRTRSESFRDDLLKRFPHIHVHCVRAELDDIESVRAACEELGNMDVDIFIHNAGAYSIPRKKCSTGLDNVFQINFASPYYMINKLLPKLRERSGRVVVVGSIAHRYSRTDPKDIDFSTRTRPSLVYGNSKRYLMFSLYELFRGEETVKLAVTHPGITFTGITAHYPKVIFAIIKYPMKIIFMKPRRACLSVLRGIFEDCGYCQWIGPRFFDIWGLPKRKQLRSCSDEEIGEIYDNAKRIFEEQAGDKIK